MHAFMYEQVLIRGVDRLVESLRIRKAMEGAYTAVLPKGACPWIYLRYVDHLRKPIA